MRTRCAIGSIARRKARAKIEKMYDARFFRMWEFYLAGGIVMFESGAACNYQVQYVRDRRATPITRDYMLEAERRYRELAQTCGAGEESRAAPDGTGRWRAPSCGDARASFDAPARSSGVIRPS